MDDIVKQSLVKWPNVPHCYGWLGLDARGYWRMRDEAAQHHDQPGDKIAHVALLGFINRNYLHDAQGRWYFQNGPQRVYVNLEATPFVAHTVAHTEAHGAPSLKLVLQTGETLEQLDAAWLTDTGQLLVQAGERVALVDDRDLARCLTHVEIDGAPAGDAALMAWLDDPAGPTVLTLAYGDQQLPVGRLASDELAGHFGFVQRPQADPANDFKE
ncbi:DUF2946 family protein [Actimicrobium antarcticum]|uniref:DUF2946 family protein n=1 Tax=Actimicrobium antarcticum TaxID=1051899 RepID=A0ABP7TC87_9BURK